VPFKPFSTQPASERDLAVLVPRELAAADLLQAINKAGRPLLEHAELIDRYEGDPVPDGLCSQAFRLRYRDPVRTLVDQQVEQVHSAIIASVQKRFKAQLRE
jgi:phenylalanyl-tRNA synthetase beta chain